MRRRACGDEDTGCPADGGTAYLARREERIVRVHPRELAPERSDHPTTIQADSMPPRRTVHLVAIACALVLAFTPVGHAQDLGWDVKAEANASLFFGNTRQ